SLSCSYRLSNISWPSAVPWASVNAGRSHRLPPTPPSTGCLGKVRFRPAGITVAVRVTSASCGPPTGLSLLRKMIRADRPAMVTPLVKEMKGPGLFSQLSTVKVATAEAVVTADWVTCQPAPWTQRPTKISPLNAPPLASTNCTQMNGLPPTPPSTGCFGITICSAAGMTVTSTVWPSVNVWVPFMLFVKVISTPYPPRKEPPENVMRGPGLLLQSYAEKSAEMETGIGRLVLLM